MRAKLPPSQKRVKQIHVPVNSAEARAIKALAKERGVSEAQILRELARRECQSVREAKKTKAA